MADSDRKPQGGGVTEVARVAGVSIATVSRVMNHPHIVAPETLRRVKDAMESLDFHLNLAASGLRRGDFQTIAIVVASLSQPWYAKLIRAIRTELGQRSYRSLVFDLEHDSNSLREYLDSISGYGPSGLIVSTGDYLDEPETRAALERARERMPLVVAGQHLEGATWPTVQYGDREGARKATLHLLDRAGPTTAFLGDLKNSYHGAERRAGYEDAMRSRGLDPFVWRWSLESVHYGAGYCETLARLEAGSVPTSILAVNDEVALGAGRAVSDFGLRIPQDIALVGFGDAPYLPYLSPSLSSVNGSVEDIARLACTALWEMFDGQTPHGVTIVKRDLVVRESSGSSGVGVALLDNASPPML